MAIFVLPDDDDVLYVFADEASARASAVVNEKTDTLCFADDGSGLLLQHAADGAGWFRPWVSCSSCHLRQVLYRVRQVINTSCEELNSVESIDRHIRRRVA